MTSIKNDAFTVGTAALAAGVTNIAAQKNPFIKKVLSTTADAFIKSAKATVKADTYKKAASKAGKVFKADTYKSIFEKFKKIKFSSLFKADTYKRLGTNISRLYKSSAAKVSSVNWGTVGKYAAVAAVAATAIVLAKNYIQNKLNGEEEYFD